MTGRDFLTTARSVVARTGEADWRTAVGRAYYAAFHAARDFLSGLGFQVPPDERAHKYLSFRLINCGHTDGSTAGLILERLRKLRTIADYNLQVAVSQPQAIDSIRLAGDVFALLDGLSTADRAAVTTAVRAYEATVLRQVTWQP